MNTLLYSSNADFGHDPLTPSPPGRDRDRRDQALAVGNATILQKYSFVEIPTNFI